jgi:N-acetylmuramoyl-L-alanine amidase
MAEDYTVVGGDCVSSIAYENGFFWKTLWNLPQNADLKTKRKNPNVLMTGDILHIPDLTIKNEPGATEATHKFMLNGVPEIFRMKLLDAFHKPRANLDYVIVIEGDSRRGKTDANGGITESIPPSAKTGQLIVAAPGDKNGKPIPGQPAKQIMNLQLGNLNPISEVSGIKARLTNLGFYQGPIDESLDDDTKRAIRAFQRRKGLPVTGVADDATKNMLLKVHGH